MLRGCPVTKAYYRGVRLAAGNFLNRQFTSNLNRLYIVLLLILKAATPVKAAQANSNSLLLALTILQSVVEMIVIRYNLLVPASLSILICSGGGLRPT